MTANELANIYTFLAIVVVGFIYEMIVLLCIEAFEMWVWQKMKKIRWIDKVKMGKY